MNYLCFTLLLVIGSATCKPLLDASSGVAAAASDIGGSLKHSLGGKIGSDIGSHSSQGGLVEGASDAVGTVVAGKAAAVGDAVDGVKKLSHLDVGGAVGDVKKAVGDVVTGDLTGVGIAVDTVGNILPKKKGLLKKNNGANTGAGTDCSSTDVNGSAPGGIISKLKTGVGASVGTVVAGKLSAAKHLGNAVQNVASGNIGGAVGNVEGAVSDVVHGDVGGVLTAVGALSGLEAAASDAASGNVGGAIGDSMSAVSGIGSHDAGGLLGATGWSF